MSSLYIVSISDPLCPRTLYNMLTKAKRPENVFVRVLQQNDPTVDPDCLATYCKRITEEKGLSIDECPYSDQIFIHNIHAKEASGPTWARGLLSKDIEDAYLKKELKPQVKGGNGIIYHAVTTYIFLIKSNFLAPLIYFRIFA